MRFSITPNHVLVCNNERGFEEKNVRAICDIGKTTKNRSRGYIGEKGIGFKSVFRVSNRPQIFSNGFQFEFTRKDENDKLGFVVPYWIPAIPHFIDPNMTNIVLPLRDEAKEEIAKFNELQPNLVLFLNRLVRLEIENAMDGKVNRVRRGPPKANGNIELEFSSGKQYWRLVRKSLRPEASINEEKRKDCKKTELVLAFPLNADGSANTQETQEVFAYLPVRSYCFKFIVQADLLLASGREDILIDKNWNKWIRDNIASAFSKAVNEFKQDVVLKYNFYNYIPLADEVPDSFFLPVVQSIHNDLKNTRCCLAESETWRKPGDLFIADNETRRLITNDDLKRILKKEYLSPKVKAERKILTALEVETFKFRHLVECLQSVDWIRRKENRWFSKLYEYLGRQQLSDQDLQILQGLQIIRLESGCLTSLSEGPIFFPLSTNVTYGFEDKLRLIKRRTVSTGRKAALLSKTTSNATPNLRPFLKKLGIKEPDSYEIIENHILPVYESAGWKKSTQTELDGFIRYIKDNIQEYKKRNDDYLNGRKKSWEVQEDPLKRLKEGLWIRNNNPQGNYYSKPGNLYMPRIYGGESALEFLFKDIANTWFVSESYIDSIIKTDTTKGKSTKMTRKAATFKKKNDAEIGKWKDFLLLLGVNNGFKLEEIHKSYLTSQDRHRLRNSDSYWQTCYSDRDPTGSQLTDYIIKSLDEILDKTIKASSTKMSEAIVRTLVNRWHYLSKFSLLEYKWYLWSWYGPARTDSSWLHILKTRAWLPTKDGGQLHFTNPPQAFVDTSEIRALFGDSVPYLAIKIGNEELVDALGINSRIDVKHVLNYLQELILVGKEDKAKFQKLYEYLDIHFNESVEDIQRSFKDSKLIYIPGKTRSYYSSDEVFWKDVSDIFGETRGYLGKHYPELKSFFLSKIQICDKPPIKDYVDVLIELTKKEDSEINKRDEGIILAVYRELEYHLDPENTDNLVSNEDWWNEFVHSGVIWIDKNEFWENENDVYVNDSSEFYELFKENQHIAFIKIPKESYPKLLRLLNAFGISPVSRAMPELESNEDSYEEIELTKQLQFLVPYILRYLYFELHDNYERLKGNGTLAQLRDLAACSVTNLRVKYTLSGQTVSTSRICLIHNGRVFVQRGCLDDTDSIALELSRFLGEPKGLDSLLISLFEKGNEQRIEGLFKLKCIGRLPTEEMKSLTSLVAPLEEGGTSEELDKAVDLDQREEVSSTESALPKVPEICLPDSEDLPIDYSNQMSTVAAILGNVSTFITFHTGLPDAQTLQKELGKFTVEDVLNLNVGECVVRMGRAESSFNVVVSPPKTPDMCLAEEVIRISRDKYCRPRRIVEQAIRDNALSVAAEDNISDRELLSAEELEFIEGIQRYPDYSTTAIYKALGLSNYSGNKIKHSLLERGLLCEVRTKLGRRKRIAKFLIPSQAVCQKLGLPPYHGRGGLIHQYLQSVVRQQAEANGYTAQVEHQIPGCDDSIDVLVERDSVTTAIEIAVSSTDERELGNINKCLAAGYDNVLALFVDASLLADTKDLVSSTLSERELCKVRFGLVNDINSFL